MNVTTVYVWILNIRKQSKAKFRTHGSFVFRRKFGLFKPIINAQHLIWYSCVQLHWVEQQIVHSNMVYSYKQMGMRSRSVQTAVWLPNIWEWNWSHLSENQTGSKFGHSLYFHTYLTLTNKNKKDYLSWCNFSDLN